METSPYLQATERWLKQVVVGLNLCPFASRPLSEGRVHLQLSPAQEPESLAKDLLQAMSWLLDHEANEIETTLLVVPHALADFEAYLDFVGWAEEMIVEIEAEGVLQIASFHPDYQFADTEADDPANFSNRSPYPILHLLREESVSAAVLAHPDAEGIPDRNVAHLRELGYAKLAALRAACLKV